MNGIGAVQAIQAFMRSFDAHASKVSRSVEVAASDETDSTANAGDLIDGMAGMDLDAIGVHAAVQVVRTQDEMLGSILDMVA